MFGQLVREVGELVDRPAGLEPEAAYHFGTQLVRAVEDANHETPAFVDHLMGERLRSHSDRDPRRRVGHLHQRVETLAVDAPCRRGGHDVQAVGDAKQRLAQPGVVGNECEVQGIPLS